MSIANKVLAACKPLEEYSLFVESGKKTNATYCIMQSVRPHKDGITDYILHFLWRKMLWQLSISQSHSESKS